LKAEIIHRALQPETISRAWSCIISLQLDLDALPAMDTLSRAERSKRMAMIHGTNTKPELRVRSIAHRTGYRYRLHDSDLPGKPDMVFPKLRKVVFVHGCFWHRHPGCSLARLPKSRLSFWLPKLTRNRQRDIRNIARLRRAGWSVKVIWECETISAEKIERKLRTFLEKINEKR
jgi:DNA mismatch endonuclease (patch repair protein)